MAVNITTLVENTVTASISPLMAEHGLSFFVQSDGRSILFDTGQGLTLLNNAASLGIDLKSIDSVVVSHGHYDHTKGLTPLAGEIGKFRLVAHDNVFEKKLACLGENCYPIGMGASPQEFEEIGIDIRLSKEPAEIAPGIITTGEIPLRNDFEKVEPMFFVDDGTGRRPDDLPDDNALIIDTAKGTVVVLGCAHRGVINTLSHVADITGKRKIHAILGGLHLFLADAERLEKVCEALAEFEIEQMAIGHCTGFPAMAALHQRFGSKMIPNSVGISLAF